VASRIFQGRILGALGISAVILVAAYLYTHRPPTLTTATPAEASETDALLKSVAAKDTDSDGLPDWEEELYGTDVNNSHSLDPKLTDSEAISAGKLQPRFTASGPTAATSSADIAAEIPGPGPDSGSLTDQFAHVFFEQYMNANQGQPPDENMQQELIGSLVGAFKQNTLNAVATHYATSTVRVDDSISVMGYITSVERLFAAHDLPASSVSPLDLLDAALNQGDHAALVKLNALAQAYAARAVGLSQLPVPSALVSTHLSLMRTFDLLAQSTALAANLEHDPLASLAGLSTYETAPAEFAGDVETLKDAVISNVGTPAKGQPGYVIWLLGEAAQGRGPRP
jgi:hypothetical protein